MLSFFPELLNWSIIVPTILRFTLAWFLFKHAMNAFYKEDATTIVVLRNIFSEKIAHIINKLIGHLRMLVSLLLVLGLFTQVASVIALVLYILRRQTRKYHGDESALDLLLAIIALSICLLGPGALSIDLPL